jgi:hypothetical protein
MSSLGDEQSRAVEASQLDQCKDLSQHMPKHVSQYMPKHSRGDEQSRGVEVSQLAQWRDMSQHMPAYAQACVAELRWRCPSIVEADAGSHWVP